MGNDATRKTARTIALAAVAVIALAGCSHEAADWKSATLANTAEAYQSFLQQYPHGREAADAQARVKQLTEDRDWQNATASNTRDAYQQFMALHADSKWSQEAKIRVENFAQADAAGGSAVADAGGTATPAVTANATSEPAEAAPRTSGAVDASVPGARSSKSAPEHSSERTRMVRPAIARSSANHAAHVLARSHGSSEWVQLGAFASKARAESQWRVLTTRFSALKALHPHYVAVRSRQRHVYRLQVRLSSSEAASGLCATLKRHAQMCLRVNA